MCDLHVTSDTRQVPNFYSSKRNLVLKYYITLIMPYAYEPINSNIWSTRLLGRQIEMRIPHMIVFMRLIKIYFFRLHNLSD